MIKISKYKINKNTKPLIIAEIGHSHNGSIKKIKEIINKISKTGVEFIKFQTHYGDEESTLDEPFRIKIKGFKNRIDYWKKMEFSLEQWKKIKKYCENKNLVFLSSPFSEKAINILNKINIAAWKIGSGEFFSNHLFKKIYNTNKPVLLSTGLSNIDEIDKKINNLKKNKIKFIILQCTSMYPCPLEYVGINFIEYLKKKYNCVVGFSDHSGSIYSPIAAITKGASIIEVHVATEKNKKNPDLTSSISINQLKELCKARDDIYKLNNPKYSKNFVSKKLKYVKKIFTKSCALKHDQKKGYILTKKDITFKKPGSGINENNIEQLIGKKLKKNISKNRLIKLSDLM